MSGPFRPGPPPGARPGPPPVPRPGPPTGFTPPDEVGEAHHPAVDAAVQAMTNAAGLPPADQIAQYEAAYQTLRETLATIDQA
ncbi:hypothetical protein [Micromonospora sp. KC721]|uniref:hypothetical protein n=1 Tax=Micromonospora sp. KC721 TaxID=2530380 RepID=UPI00104E7C87|nr:hypothetical protein [Micromonospora sp. KC721]TDB76979.1 hypothetical protein E1182_18225 [Micromonospora sp. KC721]